MFSAMHPSGFWSDLFTDYVLFAAWNFPIAKKCMSLFFYKIMIKAGTYVVTNFWFYASFSELHRYLIFLKFSCNFLNIFDHFLSFGPFVNVVS